MKSPECSVYKFIRHFQIVWQSRSSPKGITSLARHKPYIKESCCLSRLSSLYISLHLKVTFPRLFQQMFLLSKVFSWNLFVYDWALNFSVVTSRIFYKVHRLSAAEIKFALERIDREPSWAARHEESALLRLCKSFFDSCRRDSITDIVCQIRS